MSRVAVLLIGFAMSLPGVEASQGPLTGDPASLTFRGAGSVGVFEPGAVLFSDRDYKVAECPEWLIGKPFLRNSIDLPEHWVVTEPGILTVLTPVNVEKASSQTNALENAGFEHIKQPDQFQLFGQDAWNQCRIYQKQVVPGERFELGKYVVPVGFSHAEQHIEKPWSENAGEHLYNGIVLPEEWPPRNIDVNDHTPMPVPYLEHPPAVIPIDVGRQLFVDDFLIERTDMTRTFHQAEKYAGNPVFVPETEEEITRRNCVYLGQGGVFFDPEEQLFKMFYAAGMRGPLAMATSSDLIHWTRPDLSERGNVVIDRSVDDNAVWLDFREGHANERVKYMECHRGSHPHAGSQFLYTSADGLQWSEGISAGRWRGDYSSLFYNPFRKKWVFSMRAGVAMGRATYYCESGEFLEVDWDRDAVYWQGADRLDEPEPEGSYHPAAHAHGVQLYSRPAVAYESIMIGMHQIHRGPDNDICEEFKIPKLTDLELGFSRDGFHWDRPSRTAFIAGTRRDGDWDRAYLHSTTGVFVILDDRLVFPYTGFSGLGADGSRSMYHGASVGLATLRRDGFASMHAGSEPGTLTTRPVTFSGKRLFVNVDAPGGRLRAEVLDADGKPIEPFTMANSIPFSGDSTLEELKWEGGTDLSVLAGQPVRFRFELTNGSLYAFWVSKDESGRSDGYLAGGGPGYIGPTDTVGRAALR